ncbi:MAG: hypothetical protein ABI467_05395 [Kofleriaceae bacterium]
MRLALLVFAAACGSHGPHDPQGSGGDAASRMDSSSTRDDAAMVVADAPRDAAPIVDAFPAVLDVRIDCHNTCVLIANPSAIAVAAGTSFQVNWINVGDTDCDVAKIDAFNQVPIILGLEPGTSYHDPVHDWCGAQFTGTFQFQISICTIPSDIPVNCGG